MKIILCGKRNAFLIIAVHDFGNLVLAGGWGKLPVGFTA
jgi:hypothetical protein